jgi:hypothetical protein
MQSEKLKLNITTKSKIVIAGPDMKYSGITNDADDKRQSEFW